MRYKHKWITPDFTEHAKNRQVARRLLRRDYGLTHPEVSLLLNRIHHTELLERDPDDGTWMLSPTLMAQLPPTAGYHDEAAPGHGTGTGQEDPGV